MILNSLSLLRLRNILCTGVWLLLLFPVVGQAQSAQLLSVSPTLFEMSATPGQAWTSALKVVNPNPYDLTVYVSVVNFAPKGEGGDGTLIPVLETDTEGATLAEWVVVDSAPITITKEGTATVPFTVQVPASAAPGGHFAALLVGTKPPTEASGATQVRTAQIVTSLFFLRVAGDVIEEGSIREFNTQRSINVSPRADFSLRFHNTGNVHLRPQGDITISNMWGQERGIIPINRQNHFGNVLPGSIRKFSFTWEGEWSVSDIGRHKAVVTLAYGQDARQFVTSTTYFWFIPLGPVVIVLGSLAILISLLVWLVRLYVRRLLVSAGFSGHARQPYVRTIKHGDLALARPVSLTPQSTDDETRRLHPRVIRFVRTVFVLALTLVPRTISIVRLRLAETTMRELLYRHYRPLAGLLIAIVLLIAVVLFVRSALTPQRSYTVTYEGEAGGPTVSSDEIIYEEKRDAELVPTVQNSIQEGSGSVIDIVNVSGVAGAAATIALVLETEGYTIGDVTTDLTQTQGRTVIVYEGDTGDLALTLSQKLNNALLSAYNDGERSGAPVTIYIGADIATPE